MQMKLIPHNLHGSVTPPPSKSQAHRFIIAAALSRGTSQIKNIVLSQDIRATLHCIEALGASWFLDKKTLTVHGTGEKTTGNQKAADSLPWFDCGESGSTLRFFIPAALVLCGGGHFTGQGRLMERPQEPYFNLFDEKGISWSFEKKVLTVQGTLKPGTFSLPGNISSQFFTGLMFALPLLQGDSQIISTTALESQSYLDITQDVLKKSGISILQTGQTFYCKNSYYHPVCETVEADWSQAAFWYTAQFLGNSCTIQGMNRHSAQGDKIILPYLEQMQTDKEIFIDVSNCPDLVPPLAAAASLRKPGSITHITGAARLRLKESDRLHTVQATLQKLGADITENKDSLLIIGKSTLSGGCSVQSFNDHRIAMMAAIVSSRCSRPITIQGAECVAKSYPDFWEQYLSLGGRAENNM